jgi:hypothetical protein
MSIQSMRQKLHYQVIKPCMEVRPGLVSIIRSTILLCHMRFVFYSIYISSTLDTGYTIDNILGSATSIQFGVSLKTDALFKLSLKFST